MTTINQPLDRKSYAQVCPMATALDFVGDRWTVLILRELLGGPARFKELKNGLPGIATNLLTERLRRMESDGIVRRIDRGGSSSYSLTEAGGAIRTALEELGIWGARMGRISDAVHERSVRAIAMALQAVLVRTQRLPAEPVTIEIDVDGDYLEIVLGPRPSATARPAVQPDVRLEVSHPTMSAMLAGQIPDRETITHLSGDPTATQHLIDALAPPP